VIRDNESESRLTWSSRLNHSDFDGIQEFDVAARTAAERDKGIYRIFSMSPFGHTLRCDDRWVFDVPSNAMTARTATFSGPVVFDPLGDGRDVFVIHGFITTTFPLVELAHYRTGGSESG
jgi:hypothetical protein